jgi:NagD protein
METDILGAVQLGYHSVLVLSGGTRREDLQRYAYGPEVLVESLAEFAARLEKTHWRTPGFVPHPVAVPAVSELAMAQ